MDLSSIFNLFGGQNGFLQRLNIFGQQFNQKNSCTPEQKVQQMINSGQMTQEQFEQYAEIATRITGHRPFQFDTELLQG